MRIGIDATPVVYERTGVGYYAYNFLEALRQKTTNHEFVLFYNFLTGRNRLSPLEMPQANFETRIYHYPEKLLRLMWRTTGFPKVERLVGLVDIFHNLGFFTPPQSRGKKLANIYDLVFESYPQGFPERLRRFFSRVVREIVKNANLVITISEASKREIAERLEFPSERIRVIYPAPSADFKPVTEEKAKAVKERYHLNGRFCLFAGALEPRKNVSRLIEGHAMFDTRHPDEVKLVIVGPRRWNSQETLQLVKKLNLEEKVIFTDYVKQADLSALYSSAEAFVFPSLAEGFGLPILEAMSCGTPVICSKASSIPEVAGDAALFFDPMNPEEIAACLERLLDNKKLREQMVKKGFEQVRKFSWDDNVEQTLKVYEELFAEG